MFIAIRLIYKTAEKFYFSINNSSSSNKTDDKNESNDLKSVANNLKKIKYYNPPYFTFVHNLPPHEPYLDKSTCKPLSEGLHGFDLEMWSPNNIERLKELYTDSVVCVNKMVEDFVALLSEKDPGAIIIIHSDHGSYFTFPPKYIIINSIFPC